MFVAAITDDPLGIVLAIGVMVSAASAVVYFTGRPDRAAASPSKPVGRTAPREIMSASSTLARAQAAARERSSAAASADGYRLTDVRPAGTRHAAPVYPQRVQRPEPLPRAAPAAAGQSRPRTDREELDQAEVAAQARAIAFHIAENDPQRMAEVIRTWIRSDKTQEFDSR